MMGNEGRAYLQSIQAEQLHSDGLANEAELELRAEVGSEEARRSKEYYSREVHSRIYPDASPEETERHIADAMAAYATELADSPSPYEDPSLYSTMKELFAGVSKFGSTIGLSMDQPVELGSLSGRVNAMTLPVPGSEELLVIFETQLFTFTYLLAKILAQAETETVDPSVDQIESHLGQQPLIAERFYDLLANYLITGMPMLAKPYLLDGDMAVAGGLICHAMRTFIMAHEYAHLALGHISAERTRQTKIGSIDLPQYAYSWHQEYIADEVGMYLAIRALTEQDYSFPTAYAAGDFFLTAMHLFTRSLFILAHGEDVDPPSDTHPPLYLRRARLRGWMGWMGKTGTLQPLSSTRRAVRLGLTSQRIAELLWRNCPGVLLSLHQQGTRPSATWKLD
jgi:hypothetical protein